VEGEDVVAALQRELDRRGVRVRVVALVNDTVGTLMAKKLSDQRAEVGIIFGTGTNACYIEQVKNVKKLQEQGAASRMCINMEWGNFGKTEANRRLLPRGPIDDKIDAESLNQGEQAWP
jgi:hexokinase